MRDPYRFERDYTDYNVYLERIDRAVLNQRFRPIPDVQRPIRLYPHSDAEYAPINRSAPSQPISTVNAIGVEPYRRAPLPHDNRASESLDKDTVSKSSKNRVSGKQRDITNSSGEASSVPLVLPVRVKDRSTSSEEDDTASQQSFKLARAQNLTKMSSGIKGTEVEKTQRRNRNQIKPDLSFKALEGLFKTRPGKVASDPRDEVSPEANMSPGRTAQKDQVQEGQEQSQRIQNSPNVKILPASTPRPARTEDTTMSPRPKEENKGNQDEKIKSGDKQELL